MSDEQNEGESQEIAISQEQAIEQRPIPFMGDELAAARTAAGAIYITLPGMCRALGLDIRSQVHRIERSPALAKGLRVIPLETRGGVQQINCLRVDRVALWLGGVETSRIKPAYREKIEAYQDELAPVAMQVFMRVLGVQPPAPIAQLPAAPTITSAEIVEIRGQLADVYSIANLLQEHLTALHSLPDQMGQAISMLEALSERQDSADGRIARIDERTQRLTPAHARAIQELVDRMARETKRLDQPLTHANIYGRLKHRFRASTYKEIADEQYSDVMAFLQDELRRTLAGESPAQKAVCRKAVGELAAAPHAGGRKPGTGEPVLAVCAGGRRVWGNDGMSGASQRRRGERIARSRR